MRAYTAILASFVVSLAIGALGCANRGMHAPDDGGPGAAGSAGTAGRGGTSGTAGRGGTGATAGTGGAATGTGGRGGTGGTGACDLAPGADMPGSACNAMFNFETDAQGAVINAGSLGFTGVMKLGTSTFCGAGALAINTLFSGTSGPTTKGEVLINLPGAPLDLTGKTVTLHVAANPGCSADLYLSLVINTTAGAYYFSSPLQVRPITNMWKTATATVTPDAGTMSALAISLQAFSVSGYTGTIYVDEIDIR